jgi:Sec-independent protein translocase protein TatA
MLGIWETIGIIAIVFAFILWFGKKAPETAKSAGQCVREFKQGLKDLPEAVDEVKTELNK